MERFNSAVVGTGGMGKVHVQAQLESPVTEKVFIVEPNAELAEKHRKELGVIPVSFEEMLADKSIRFVSIASPNAFHKEQAIACMRAGKAVLLEKPMGCDLEEARQIVQVERETGAFLQVGFELRYSRLYQMAREWIEAGLIGEPVNIQNQYYCCEFHRKGTWRSNGTGCFLIGEKLSHYLDMQRYYFNDEFESVYSLSSAQVVPYFRHKDNHQIMIRFPNGKVGVLNFIMYLAETDYNEVAKDPLRDVLEKQADDGHRLTAIICGTKGAIETDVFRRRIRRWEFGEREDGMTSKIVETVRFTKENELEYIHNVHGEVLDALDLVANGRPSKMPGTSALEAMKLCFAAEKSDETGMIVKRTDI